MRRAPQDGQRTYGNVSRVPKSISRSTIRSASDVLPHIGHGSGKAHLGTRREGVHGQHIRPAETGIATRPRFEAFGDVGVRYPPHPSRECRDPTAGSHVRMTSRTKPTAKRSSRFGNDNRNRHSLYVNLAFGIVILIGVITLVGAAAATYLGAHFAEAAKVNGQTITEDDVNQRGLVDGFRLNAAE